MDLKTFIEYNFAPIVGLIFQLAIVLFTKNFTKKERIIFFITLGLQSLEIISYNVEFYFAELDTYNVGRTIFSVIGYILRPALIYPFILLLRPKTNPKYAKLWYLDLIPFVFCVIVQQFAFYTDWVFWFSSDNHFHRGPLGYVSQVVTILYLVEAAVLMILSKVINKKINISLIIIIMAYVAFAIIFESVFGLRSLGISAGVFSIIFFMFSLQANHLNETSAKLKELSEVDSLSKLTNRYAGELLINEAIDKKEKGVFIILDIDKFKHINDTYGHTFGDEAIIDLSKILKDSFNSDDVIMRLGGDEFAIFSTHYNSYEEIKDVVNKLFEKVNSIELACDTNYRMSISLGLACYDGGNDSTFDTLYKNADIKLYEAKKEEGNYISY